MTIRNKIWNTVSWTENVKGDVTKKYDRNLLKEILTSRLKYVKIWYLKLKVFVISKNFCMN